MSTKNEETIDLLSLAKVLLQHKKLYAITCTIALVISIVISFSIPKTYETEITLAPELSNGLGGLGNGLSDIASMVGVNIGDNNSIDAIYPEMYPQIVSSTPFLTDLFKYKLNVSNKGDKELTLYEYLTKEYKHPWWETIKAATTKIFKSKKKPLVSSNKKRTNIIELNEEQNGIAEQIKSMISCKVDKKTSVITIKVTTQDALTSAQLADGVKEKLQQFITNYRTKKARNDMEYAQKLYIESKQQYVKSQQLYSTFSDSNSDLILATYKAKQEELENEMQLRYNIYNQCAQQLQLAKAKVQERTPAFTEIQPATVSLKKAGPKRMSYAVIFIFVSIVFTSLYILYKNAQIKK